MRSHAQLYLGGLPWDASDGELQELAEEVGRVRYCKIVRGDGNVSKGFAFVGYEARSLELVTWSSFFPRLASAEAFFQQDPGVVDKAIAKLDGYRWKGRTLKCNHAVDRNARDVRPKRRPLALHSLHEPAAATVADA